MPIFFKANPAAAAKIRENHVAVARDIVPEPIMFPVYERAKKGQRGRLIGHASHYAQASALANGDVQWKSYSDGPGWIRHGGT